MTAVNPPGSGPHGLYRTLVDHMPNGVLVLFDAELRYRVVGPSVLPFSGRIAASMTGKTIEELFPAETVDSLRPELEATIAGTARSFDLEYDGLVHHVETAPVTVEGQEEDGEIGDEGKDAAYGVLLTQDVTEERALGAALERQNERLDRFASMLSHDVRNPLAIALGRLELYRDTGDEAHLTDVERALRRIEGLTAELTALVRAVPADADEGVALAAVAEDAWDGVDTASATLSVADGTVSCPAGGLQALLENLFRNAVENGGGSVAVRVGPLEGGFYVEDDGPGIPPEKRGRVFEHGFTTREAGNGIGLTIVSHVAEANGLAVGLTDAADSGARFEFTPARPGT